MGELLENRQEFNHVSTDFLKLDVATALTYTKTALETEDAAKKSRNQRAARRAYDTVQRLAKKVDLSRDDAEVLSSGLERLKSELQTLGETF